MEIIVKSKNCEVPARLKEEAVERVEHAMRFFDRVLGVEMVFSEEQNPRIPEPASVEVTVRTKGHQIRAQGSGDDHRGAIDAAAARLERQLAKYKRRLVDRRRKAKSAPPSTLAPIPDHLAEDGPMPASRDGDAPRTGDAPSGGPLRSAALDAVASEPAPRIVRHKRFEMVPMLPEDAALHLELLGHDFYLFTNASTGAANVIYRRRGGDLGLIEPTDDEGAALEPVAAPLRATD